MRSHNFTVTWNPRGFTLNYRGFYYAELNMLTEDRYFVTRESANGALVDRTYDGSASHTIEGSKHVAAFIRRVDKWFDA